MMDWKFSRYSLGEQPDGMQPVKSTFRNRVEPPTGYLKDKPLSLQPNPPDPHCDEGVASAPGLNFNKDSPPI